MFFAHGQVCPSDVAVNMARASCHACHDAGAMLQATQMCFYRREDETPTDGRRAVAEEHLETATDEQLLNALQRVADEHGKVGAATLLRLNFRTLDSALRTERVSPHVRAAAQRYLGDPADPDAESQSQPAAQREQRRLALEQRVDDLFNEVSALRAVIGELQERLAEGTDSGPLPEHIGRLTAEPAPPFARTYPTVVPGEALPGEVWPDVVQGAVDEWREAQADRATARHTLAWLRASRRLIELELQLADEHQLTLPPADYPWSNARRRRELRTRRAALNHIRLQLFWTKPLHWLMRAVTLGLWGR